MIYKIHKRKYNLKVMTNFKKFYNLVHLLKKDFFKSQNLQKIFNQFMISKRNKNKPKQVNKYKNKAVLNPNQQKIQKKQLLLNLEVLVILIKIKTLFKMKKFKI